MGQVLQDDLNTNVTYKVQYYQQLDLYIDN